MKCFLIKVIAVSAMLCIATANSEHREKRQIGDKYYFPGPRAQSDYTPETAAAERRAQYEDLNGYSVSTPRQQTASAQTYRPQLADAYSTPYSRPQYSNDQYRGNARSSGYNPAPKPYTKPSNQNYADVSSGPESKKLSEEEEEEQKPSKLELLLQTSKFGCSNKKDGYYADSSVNCEVFHYCVGGAKHSWMCPEGTVFHQVHLNCVPASQDICSESDKYSAQVNDFLYKPLDQKGPNNTIRYHQRFYPEQFIGEPLQSGFPQTQTYGVSPQAPAPKPSAPVRPYNEYDNSYNSNEDEYIPSTPIRPQPKPQTSSYPSFSSYQPKPAPVPPNVYKPTVVKHAPAPQPYTAPSYRAQPASEQRRPVTPANYPESYNSYAASLAAPINKPTSYNSYPAAAPASYGVSPKPVSSFPSQPNYKLQSSPNYTPTRYSSSNTFKPIASNPKSSGNTYPSSYRAYSPYSSSNYDSSESLSKPRYGNNQPLRPAGDFSGVAYEEDY
ncbi:early nodulin-75-like protein [Dinothrombium tinctorium]|uniref:Early nodulin-75-like protein n=1 Tax=Dinothrombium tinctorium TaxID=1965070 RepID=A0A3S3QAT4_9ACAR|nr:early nodulin-75-like protein [Dinothrombium tinctorium]